MPQPSLACGPWIPWPPIRVDRADTVLQPKPPQEPVGREAAPYGADLQAQDGPAPDIVCYPEPPRPTMNPDLGLINKGSTALG
jgi:hypothetical protein